MWLVRKLSLGGCSRLNIIMSASMTYAMHISDDKDWPSSQPVDLLVTSPLLKERDRGAVAHVQLLIYLASKDACM